MKIEIWSDFTCPYCFLGKKRFDLAIEQFGNIEAIDLEFKSFELAPYANKENSVEKADMLIDKYQLTKEEAVCLEEEVKEQGKEMGLPITLDNVVHTNTFQAHRLVKYSSKSNKAHTLIDLLFHSYFIDKENIGKRNVLHRLAVEAGLDREEVDALLCLNHYAKAVRYDEQLAEELGIAEVPFFIFNEEYAISGLQPTEIFTNILNELWDEEVARAKWDRKQKHVKAYCVGNECNLDG